MPQSEGKPREALSARSRIYRFLYESQDFCSRQVLAASCGVSMPTLYQNLGDLMADGLVRYTGEDQFTGGRRAQGLDIVPEARVSLGVSVTEHNLCLVAQYQWSSKAVFRRKCIVFTQFDGNNVVISFKLRNIDVNRHTFLQLLDDIRQVWSNDGRICFTIMCQVCRSLATNHKTGSRIGSDRQFVAIYLAQNHIF